MVVSARKLQRMKAQVAFLWNGVARQLPVQFAPRSAKNHNDGLRGNKGSYIVLFLEFL